MAVFVLYAKRILTNFELIKKIIVAFIPTAIVGLTFYPIIKDFLLGSSTVTLNALFWGGIVLIVVERLLKKYKVVEKSQKEPTYKQSLLIGVFQSFAVVPGVSRAAATIIGGLVTGLDRESATEFSFLLAIPTMFAASALDIYKSKEILFSSNLNTLVIGTFLSFVFALIAVKFLINYVKKHDFTVFGVYRIILAVFFWMLVK